MIKVGNLVKWRNDGFTGDYIFIVKEIDKEGFFTCRLVVNTLVPKHETPIGKTTQMSRKVIYNNYELYYNELAEILFGG